MTPEETKQLRPGDRILVEIQLCPNDIVSDDGYVRLINRYLNPKSIREKLSPPRRTFRAGDIVLLQNNILNVIEDESSDGVLVSVINKNTVGTLTNPHDLTLICAADNREDRKENEV